MNGLCAVAVERGGSILVLPVKKDWAAVARALADTLREQGVRAFLDDAELAGLARRLAAEVAAAVYPGLFGS